MARRGEDNEHTKSGQLCRRGQYRIQREMMTMSYQIGIIFFPWFGRTINVVFNDLFIKVSTSAEMNRGKDH